MYEAAAPCLTIIGNGRLEGVPRQFPLRPGTWIAGRSPDADFALPFPELSREHALIRCDGDQVTVADADSTNGTWVNDERVTASRALHPGDVVRLGKVELRYEPSCHATAQIPPGPPVSAIPGAGVPAVGNHIGGDAFGDVVTAGRDVNYQRWDIENNLAPDDPLDELFKGRGPGRVVMVVGLLIAVAGFAGWMALIFSGIGSNDPTGPTPFDHELLGLPALAVAFASFALGGVVASIGMAMSKAARERHAEVARGVHGSWR